MNGEPFFSSQTPIGQDARTTGHPSVSSASLCSQSLSPWVPGNPRLSTYRREQARMVFTVKVLIKKH